MGISDNRWWTYMCHLSETYQGSHITPTVHVSLYYWASTSLNSSLLTFRIHEVVSMPIHVHPLDTIGNETCLTRKHVSNHQKPSITLDRPRQGVKLCVLQSSKGTRVGLQLQKPTSMMFSWMVCTLTLVDGLALKFAAICGRVALHVEQFSSFVISGHSDVGALMFYQIPDCIVLKGWSLLPNALRSFQDLLCSSEFRYY